MAAMVDDPSQASQALGLPTEQPSTWLASDQAPAAREIPTRSNFPETWLFESIDKYVDRTLV